MKALGVMAGALVLGIIAGFDIRGTKYEPQGRVAQGLFAISRVVPVLLITAYYFGTQVYPWVKPHFGGAAVREGYLMPKPGIPEGINHLLRNQPVLLLDQDEQFLYLATCPDSTKSEVILLPLESLAAISVETTQDRFVAIPASINKPQCGRRAPK